MSHFPHKESDCFPLHTGGASASIKLAEKISPRFVEISWPLRVHFDSSLLSMKPAPLVCVIAVWHMWYGDNSCRYSQHQRRLNMCEIMFSTGSMPYGSLKLALIMGIIARSLAVTCQDTQTTHTGIFVRRVSKFWSQMVLSIMWYLYNDCFGDKNL